MGSAAASQYNVHTCTATLSHPASCHQSLAFTGGDIFGVATVGLLAVTAGVVLRQKFLGVSGR